MIFPGKRATRRRKARRGSPAAAGMRLALGLARMAAQGMTALVTPPKPARKAGPKPAAPAAPRPRASFSSGTQDGLRYRLFKPGLPAGAPPPPLLVMLHGCAQTPEDFATGTGMNALARERGVIVLYPAQSAQAHPNRCWHWFDAGHVGRGRGEAAMIASLTRRILQTHGADPARVYVAGLSAGASMALALAHAYPDLYAAVGVHSGLALGSARDQGSALVAMQRGNPGIRLQYPVPTIVFHGSHDAVVHPRNGRLVAIRAREPWAGLRHAQSAGRVAGGHAYGRSIDRMNAGRPLVEHWTVRGAGHAWSGGSPRGRFTDAKGPDASREMLRFFLRHSLSARSRKARALALA